MKVVCSLSTLVSMVVVAAVSGLLAGWVLAVHRLDPDAADHSRQRVQQTARVHRAEPEPVREEVTRDGDPHDPDLLGQRADVLAGVTTGAVWLAPIGSCRPQHRDVPECTRA
jgi:hypothetical protein